MPKPRLLNQDQIQEIIKMKEKGISLRKISEKFGVVHGTVYNYIKRSKQDEAQ